jgi:hypothetical protein
MGNRQLAIKQRATARKESKMKDKAWAIGVLTKKIDEADAAIARFLANNSEEDVEKLLTGYIRMAGGKNGRDCLTGVLCAASLARGMRVQLMGE